MILGIEPRIAFLVLAAGAVAFVITHSMVPLVTRVAMALRAVDYPGGRRQQGSAIPRLGGLALVAGLGFAGGAVALTQWIPLSGEISRTEMVAMAIATGMVFLLGLIDDVTSISAWKKFVVQIAAAALVVQVGWAFRVVSLPTTDMHLDLGVMGPVFTVLWIVGVTNAVNLLDGLDGLAGGVVAIIAASFLTYAVILGNSGTVILMAATVGACLGFLRHNWAPARIYMGDSGSLTLGFLLGAMSVHSSIKAPTAVAILVPLLALGLPVIDTLLVMGVRFLARPHSRPAERLLAMFHADRNHLHHLLLHWGPTRSRVVHWVYGIVVAFCALALLVAVTRNIPLGLALVGVQLVVVLGVRRLGMRARVAELASRRKEELQGELAGPAGDPRTAAWRPPPWAS